MNGRLVFALTHGLALKTLGATFAPPQTGPLAESQAQIEPVIPGLGGITINRPRKNAQMLLADDAPTR